MRAATHHTYGSPDVIEIAEVAKPSIGAREVLVQIRASSVTQGDRRLRASDYPRGLWIVGRMMSGLVRPRHPVPGTTFAGKVVEVGSEVSKFQVGDDVFGGCLGGAQAEFMAISEDSAIARMPANTGYDEAATLSYGASTALVFMRDIAEVKPGERVLIVGADGGVGRYAVQLARYFGAEVTGVCRRNFEAVRELGAHHVIDATREDFRDKKGHYDVIFDTPDVTRFSQCREALTPTGRYLSLYVSLHLLFHVAMTAVFGGRKAKFTVAMGDQKLTNELRALVEAGAIRAVIDQRYPLEQAALAHARLETKGRPFGSVVVSVGGASLSHARA